MKSGTRNLYLVSIVWLFLIVSVLPVFDAWKEMVKAPWVDERSDLATLNSLYLKETNPALFAKDYIYSSDRYLAFYTPSFVHLTTAVGKYTGDLNTALLTIQLPLIFIYLCSAALFFWQLTASPVLGVVFAIISVTGIQALYDFWQLNPVLPRTLALPPALLAGFFYFWQLKQNSTGGWLLCGLAVGLTMNMHPTTGMALALVLGLAAGAGWLRLRNPGFTSILMLITGTLIAALPIIQNINANSGVTSAPIVDFQTFATAFSNRILMLPFPQGSVDWHLTLFTPEIQTLLALGWLPLSMVLWLLLQLYPRSPASLVFSLVQIAYTWLMVQSLPLEWAGLLIAYIAWRWWQADIDLELRLLEITAGIIGISLFLPVVLHPVWLQFELWNLTMFLAEFGRGSRLLAIPIYGLLAVAALRIWQTLPHIRVTLQRMNFYQKIQQSPPGIQLILSITGSAAAMLVILRLAVYIQFFVPLLIGSLVGIALWSWHSGWTQGTGFGRLLIFLLVAGLLICIGNNAAVFGLTHLFPALIAITPLAFVVWDKKRHPARSPVIYAVSYMLAVTVGGLFVMSFSARSIYDNRDNPASTSPLIVAALWAKTNTPLDALFYYASASPRHSATMSQFRVYSERSVSHSYKDLSMVAYSHPDDLVALTLRQDRLEALAGTPEGIVTAVQDINADYVLLNYHEYNAPSDWQEVYRNIGYAIYQVESSEGQN